jgi:iron(III) transport system ATP-binding protein
MTFALQLHGLRHSYGGVEVLHGLDLTVAAGTTLAILGPSGCGKSTLLRLVAGFERPQSGSIAIGGRTVARVGAEAPEVSVSPQRRDMGYVAQEGSLFPHLTVRRNIAFGLPRRQRRDRERVVELLGLVALSADYLDRYPHELSGGQQQRIALARALSRRPSLVLLDEPFSALDTDLRIATRTAVVAALQSAGVTTVLVTHDQGEALSFADTLAVMVDGRFTQVGEATQVYESPADLQTASLVGSTLVLDGTVRDGVASTALGPIDVRGPSPIGAASILLRPEQFAVRPLVYAASERAGRTSGPRVRKVEFFGHDRVLEIDWPDRNLWGIRARVPGQVECGIEDPVEITVTGTGIAFPQR